MKRTFIVTGATGLVGSNLIRKLKELKEEVKILVLPDEEIKGFDPEGIKIYYGNVCDKESMKEFFKKEKEEVQICIHCAGIITISNKNSDNVYKVNVEGTKNIIDLCKKNNTDKLVYVSSVHAIKEIPKDEVIKETNDFNPDYVEGLYAKTKATATALVYEAAKKDLNATIVHPSGIIGPYDYNEGNFTTLIKSCVQRKIPAIVSGGYDFVDARDVVDGIIAAALKGKKGECYILSNRYYSVKELFKEISKITNTKEIKAELPRWFIVPLAPLAEVYYRITKQKPLFTTYSLRVLETNANFSHEKATKELDYNPRPLQRTLKDTISWMKESKKI